MKFLNLVWQKSDKVLWLSSILIGVILTLVADKLPFISRVMMVEYVLILINCLFSIWSGLRIRQNHNHWGMLLIFPVLYLITAYFVLPKYTYYFALVYLAISYLAWSMRGSSN